MNNGGKAEKENTPNEANLQEEEVRRGSLRRGYDLGRRPRAFSRVWAAGRRGSDAGPGAPQSRVWELPSPRGTAPNCGPGRGGVLFGERVFVGS